MCIDRRIARPFPEHIIDKSRHNGANIQSIGRTTNTGPSTNYFGWPGRSADRSKSTPSATAPPTTPPGRSTSQCAAKRRRDGAATETENTFLYQLWQRIRRQARPVATQSPSPERQLHIAYTRLRMRQSILPEESLDAASTSTFGNETVGRFVAAAVPATGTFQPPIRFVEDSSHFFLNESLHFDES